MNIIAGTSFYQGTQTLCIYRPYEITAVGELHYITILELKHSTLVNEGKVLHLQFI